MTTVLTTFIPAKHAVTSTTSATYWSGRKFSRISRGGAWGAGTGATGGTLRSWSPIRDRRGSTCRKSTSGAPNVGVWFCPTGGIGPALGAPGTVAGPVHPSSRGATGAAAAAAGGTATGVGCDTGGFSAGSSGVGIGLALCSILWNEDVNTNMHNNIGNTCREEGQITMFKINWIPFTNGTYKYGNCNIFGAKFPLFKFLLPNWWEVF